MTDTTSSNIMSLSEQAAEWVVCMSDKHITPAQRAEFEAWLKKDSRHREAYEEIEMLWQNRTSQKRQRRSGVTIFLGIIALFGCFYGLPFSVWLADERTGMTEIRRIALPDGNHLILDGNSAVDISFDSQQRRIILHRGRLLAEVAPVLSDEHSPFTVETRDGTAQALGTRYIVEQNDHDSTVTVIESKVAVANRARPHEYITLQDGQSIHFDSQRLQQPEIASPFAASWAQQRLIYQNTSLDTVISDLSRYRSNYLSINTQAAQLRFTGVLPTNDPEAALSILENALPIRITRYGGWIIRIENDYKQLN